MTNTMTKKIKSKMLKNKLLTLLGTYFIAFTSLEGFPVPIILMLLNFNEIILKISPIGFMLGIFSIIGVISIKLNKHKKTPGWIIFQLGVVFTMYLSWLILTIYGNNIAKTGFNSLKSFMVFLLISTPFQIAFLINTKEIIEDFFLIKLNKIIKINIKPFYYILFICFLYLFVRPGG